MFKYTLDNKRYHTLNYFFKTKFGQKTVKVPIDIDSPCPHAQNGGCIFCSNKSKAVIIKKTDTIIEQFNETKKTLEKKWPNSLYIPYFQSGTNTNLPVKIIKPIIDILLTLPNVVGISIATRPDCLPPEWLTYLEELNQKTFLMIEIGLQSANDKTLQYINRGHDLHSFTQAVEKLKAKNIFIVAHIINGLPYETKEDMLNTVKYLNDLQIDALKIHMLYISKNTTLEEIFYQEKFPLLTKEEYIDIVCDQLTLLDETIVIERITGDPIEDELIAPSWLLKKFCVLNDIDKEMKKRDIYQGQNTKKTSH